MFGVWLSLAEIEECRSMFRKQMWSVWSWVVLEVGLVQCVLVYVYICNALMHDLVWLRCLLCK